MLSIENSMKRYTAILPKQLFYKICYQLKTVWRNMIRRMHLTN